MRHSLIFLAALALLAVPASAQEQDSPSQIVSETDPDLRCSIWAGALLGVVEDQEAKTGITAAFTFFMGRFEGRTDQAIEHSMTPELIESETQNMAALTQLCLPQMESLGQRLTTFGDAIVQSQEDGAAL